MSNSIGAGEEEEEKKKKCRRRGHHVSVSAQPTVQEETAQPAHHLLRSTIIIFVPMEGKANDNHKTMEVATFDGFLGIVLFLSRDVMLPHNYYLHAFLYMTYFSNVFRCRKFARGILTFIKENDHYSTGDLVNKSRFQKLPG
jgi:hypothetical protein